MECCRRIPNKGLGFAKETKLCGEEHRDTLTAMTCLASSYWDRNEGQRDQAVKLYETVLAVRRRTYNHPVA